MGLTAISSVSGSTSVTSLFSPVGFGVGGIFAVMALVALLVSLNLLDASEREAPNLKRTLIATIVPLFFTFAGIVLFKSLLVI